MYEYLLSACSIGFFWLNIVFYSLEASIFILGSVLYIYEGIGKHTMSYNKRLFFQIGINMYTHLFQLPSLYVCVCNHKLWSGANNLSKHCYIMQNIEDHA